MAVRSSSQTSPAAIRGGTNDTRGPIESESLLDPGAARSHVFLRGPRRGVAHVKAFRRVSATIWITFCGCNADSGSGVNRDAGAESLFAPGIDSGSGNARAPDAAGIGVGHKYDNAILSFVAARAYHDFPSLDVKSDSKFEAFLLPTIQPSEIESIQVSGPEGFTFDIMNAPFADNLNGYLLNDRLPTLWYQAIRASTLADGRYTLRITFKTGERQEYSRVLASNDALVSFYLAHKDDLQFQPNAGASAATDTLLTWSTLRELGGPDAYYNAWISSGTAEAIGEENLRGDNIFFAALLDRNAGLNVSSSRLSSAIDPLPLGPVTWQVEIVDSNQLDGINQIIFPPGHHFIAQ
jgi:hypothetical protein